MRKLFGSILLCVLMSCAPVHKFTPLPDVDFPPHPADFTIDFFPDAPPSQSHFVIGHVECRGATLDEVVPFFKKLAREHGGDAVAEVKSTIMSEDLYLFTATVVRYR